MPCRHSSASPPRPGTSTLPALWLFLIVFLWTPPHFWALASDDQGALRGRERADAAGHAWRSRDDAADPALLASCWSRSPSRVGWWLGPVYTVAARRCSARTSSCSRGSSAATRRVVAPSSCSTTRSRTWRCCSSRPRSTRCSSEAGTRQHDPPLEGGRASRRCRHTAYAIRPPRPPRRVRCHAALRLRARAERPVPRLPAGPQAVPPPCQRGPGPRLLPHSVVLLEPGPRGRSLRVPARQEHQLQREHRLLGHGLRPQARQRRSRSRCPG